MSRKYFPVAYLLTSVLFLVSALLTGCKEPARPPDIDRTSIRINVDWGFTETDGRAPRDVFSSDAGTDAQTDALID